jgi:hypothetical protein
MQKSMDKNVFRHLRTVLAFTAAIVMKLKAFSSFLNVMSPEFYSPEGKKTQTIGAKFIYSPKQSVVFNAMIFTKITTALRYYPGELLY